jgi:hypothetical protein
MKRMREFLSIFFLFLFLFSFTQNKISGKVLDKKTKQPIGFVDVIGVNSNFYTSTNVDGKFFIEVDETVKEIEFQLAGYDNQMYKIEKSATYELVIFLQPTTEQLSEVIVKTKMKKFKNKKENPAYRIMKEVWSRKRKSGLKVFDNYQYEEYEKIQADLNNIDSNFIKKKIFRKLEFVFDNIDTSSVTGKSFLPIFINESLTKIVGQNEPHSRIKKELIANKTSGFQDNEVVASTAKNLYREYDVYENRINFFDKNFVSPIATDGFLHYEYELRDSILVDGIETYKIKYYPKRPGELTFKGTFFISKQNYAVKEITLATTKGLNVNFVRDIYIEQKYDLINDSVFVPIKNYTLIDLSLFTKGDKSKGMYIHRTVSFKNYTFNQTLPQNVFDRTSVEESLEVYKKEDEFWENNRHIELSKKDTQIYSTLDRLQKTPKFIRTLNIIETLASGYYNAWNSFDFGDLGSTFGQNGIEGIRIKVGGRTYFSRNDLWRIQGYLAYGFKDERFKFATEYRHIIDKNKRFMLGIGVKKDIEQMGVQLIQDEGVMTRSFGSSALIQRGNNTSLSNLFKSNAFASIEVLKNVTLRLDATFQEITTQSPDFKIDFLKNNQIKSNLIDAHTTLSLVARPKARFSYYGVDRQEHTSLTPTFILKYTRGFEGIFNSDFNYNKLQFLYAHPILIGSVGKLNLSTELGKTFNPVPISLLSIMPGNQSLTLVPNIFSQLNYYEFVADTYGILVLEHHFNGRLFNYIPLLKKLNFREVVAFRTAWGTISDENKQINASSIQYVAPDSELYYEYGLGIENVGIGNFRPLRVDFNWRGNYLDKPNISRFGIKIGLQVNF